MVTNFERFKNNAIREVEIPGDEQGEFTIKIKSLSMLTLVQSGKIPNGLMEKASSLFNGADVSMYTEDDANELASKMKMEDLATMANLLDTVCEAVMYEPTFAEVGEFLTQEQKEAIFDYSQAGIKAVTPIATK